MCSKFSSRDGDYIDLRSSDRKEERTSIFNGAAEPGRRSANGAKYDSQGQARSASPLVFRNQLKRALKVRNIIAVITLFQSFTVGNAWTQGRRASLC
jgi:hypothetical protein